MLKRSIGWLSILVIIAVVLTACSAPVTTGPAPGSPTNSSVSTIATHPPVVPTRSSPGTQFSRMLNLAPYSFMDKQDIWFGDQSAIKKLYGFEDINSLDDFNRLSPEKQKELSLAMEGVAGLHSSGNWRRINPAESGFDVFMIEQTLFDPQFVPPPRTFTILRGIFDNKVISARLTALGYQNVEYEPYGYLSLNDDYAFNAGGQMNPIASQVLSAMNRVALLEDSIAAGPATKTLTDILDATLNKQKAITDDPVCRALVSSLGEVLSGVILTPQRVMSPGLPINVEHLPKFQFKAPPDWGILHQYDVAAVGFKDNGKDKYWVISLHYSDLQSATVDAGLMVKRLNSYVFNTSFDQGQPHTKWTPLTDRYEVGQPVVQESGSGGANLTIQCRFKPDTRPSSWLTPFQNGPYRDVLFLAPDPAPYLANP